MDRSAEHLTGIDDRIVEIQLVHPETLLITSATAFTGELEVECSASEVKSVILLDF